MSVSKEIFDSNLQRVDSLSALYSQLKADKQTDKNKDYKFTDMLRAATVLLHSAFEEYFRSIITEWLPSRGSKEALKAIVLPTDAGKNGTKYTLSDLLTFSDKTVGEMFQEAVSENMSRTTFNSYSEICAWASKINLDLSAFSLASDIDKAVHRRHKIVHEADLDTKSKLRGIQNSDINQWRKAYSELVTLIDSQVDTWSTAGTADTEEKP